MSRLADGGRGGADGHPCAQAAGRAGVVARTRSSSDDRLVLVGLTSGGRARVIKAQSAFRARQQEVFEELSVADRRAMTDSLTRLAALINDNMDARA